LVRIPGWAQNEAVPSDLYTFTSPASQKTVIKINGQPVEYQVEKGYAVLDKKWKKGDIVEVSLPMEVRRVIANEKVKDDAGKVALQVGPLMYCAEWVDNNGRASNFILPGSAEFKKEFKPELLNGLTVLSSELPAVFIDSKGEQITTEKKPFVAIPYYAWANRGKGEMMIWFPAVVKDIDLISKEDITPIHTK
jgi:DUF1680 family protein